MRRHDGGNLWSSRWRSRREQIVFAMMRFLAIFSTSLRRPLAARRRLPAATAAVGTFVVVSAAAWLSSAGPARAASERAPGAATCESSDLAVIALARINALRAAGADCRSAGRIAPSAQLEWSDPLTLAAQRHVQDMVAKNFFSHAGSNGSTPGQRVRAAGFAWRLVGENVAVGYYDVDAVLAGFMAADGHCANLMDAGYTVVSLACQPGSATNAYANYWAMDLARPR